MKIPDVKKKNKSKKKSVSKPKKEQIQIIAHEIKFARLLSGNEKKSRDRALKALKKWLLNCFEKGYEFKEDDFSRIWKGLFYAVWMSDKPLIQEELCESIAGILDLFPPEHYHYALMMGKVGLQTMATEWYGIDHHRMDKCLMLVRRYLRGSLRCVARSGWSQEACEAYADMLSGKDGILALQTPIYARNATSMILHFTDCYLEELSKVSEGSIPGSSLVALLAPFCAYTCSGRSPVLCVASRRLLTALLRQSDQARGYREKTRAWEQMGCPAGGPDALQEVSDDDEDSGDDDNDAQSEDEDREKALDPRAGRVNVFLDPLPVPATEIAELLTKLKSKASGKAFRRLNIMIQRFRQVAANECPLKVEELSLDEGPKVPPPKKIVSSLQSLEKQLMATSDELALRGLSRKHRKRLLAKSRAGISIVDEAVLAHTKNNAAGDWKVEETKPETKNKVKQNRENFEKRNKKRKIEANGDVTRKTKKRKIGNKKTNDAERNNKTALNTPKKSKTNGDLDTPKKSKTNGDLDTSKKSKTNEEESKLKNKANQKKTNEKITAINKTKTPTTVVSKKVKKVQLQKKLSPKEASSIHSTPKKVKFVLKNNSMQETMDYHKSVRQSPNIPFDSSKTPSKANLKPSTPSPINPFFKKKWKIH